MDSLRLSMVEAICDQVAHPRFHITGQNFGAQQILLARHALDKVPNSFLSEVRGKFRSFSPPVLKDIGFAQPRQFVTPAVFLRWNPGNTCKQITSTFAGPSGHSTPHYVGSVFALESWKIRQRCSMKGTCALHTGFECDPRSCQKCFMPLESLGLVNSQRDTGRC